MFRENVIHLLGRAAKRPRDDVDARGEILNLTSGPLGPSSPRAPIIVLRPEDPIKNGALRVLPPAHLVEPPPSRPVARPGHDVDVDLCDTNGDFHVDRIFEELNLRPSDVARALDIRPQQIYAWLKTSPLRPTNQRAYELLLVLTRVITLARGLWREPSPVRRQLWFHNANLAFRGERPVDLVLSGRGQEVADALWSRYVGDVSL